MFRRAFLKIIGLAPAAGVVTASQGPGAPVPPVSPHPFGTWVDGSAPQLTSTEAEDNDDFHLFNARQRVESHAYADRFGLDTNAAGAYLISSRDFSEFRSWSPVYRKLATLAHYKEQDRKADKERLMRELKLKLIPYELRRFFR